jgi:hypothetical protein
MEQLSSETITQLFKVVFLSVSMKKSVQRENREAGG